MPLSSIVIIGQTGMKCRKNRKNVKLRYTNDIWDDFLERRVDQEEITAATDYIFNAETFLRILMMRILELYIYYRNCQ